MIALINCKDLFSDCLIDNIKEHMDNYHQGFVLVGDELYIPRYKVIQLGLDHDDDVEVITLCDWSQVTATDEVAKYFGDVFDLCSDSYWQGYDDGFKA